MNDFQFQNTTKVYFGKDQLGHLHEEVLKYGKSVLVVYGGGSIKKIGLYDKVMKELKDNNVEVYELAGVEPNPRHTTVNKGAKICKENNITAVLGIGGGSTIDASKAIAALTLVDTDNIWDLVEKKVAWHDALPVLAMPTIASTGSEMDKSCVIANVEKGVKSGINGDILRPRASFLDPTNTFSVSPKQTVCGGFDIMAHLFDMNYFVNSDKYPLQFNIVETLLRTVRQQLPIAVKEPENYSARATMLWAASWALNSFCTSGYKTQAQLHALEQFSSTYDMTHGLALAIITPKWMTYLLNKDETVARDFARFGLNVMGIQDQGDDMANAKAGIEALQNFIKDELHLPTTLSEMNITDEKFDELKVPSIPFYKAKTKHYYGIEEMKQGELNFFKGTVLSKSKEDIFMCSDMPMEDMAKDIDFGKKWMFAIAMCLKKGHHLNIIHNLDRPFNEMMLGLESWIPIYMTGQISPYYLSNLKNNIYNHLNYVSAAAALSGECINGFHNKGMYYLTTNKNEIEYYKEKSDLLLKKAKPLMEIYRESNIKEYHLFLKKDENIECDRTRYISSLPLFTISDELLIKILKRNKLTKEEIDKIIKYKNNEFKYMNSILKKNKVFDYIYVIKEDEFISDTPSLLLNNLFIDKTINYTYKEYIEHLKLTNEYAKNNKNYNILTEKDKTFKNITITILKNNHVIISKNSNPTIHFVIRHPKLVAAIESFNPLVKEL